MTDDVENLLNQYRPAGPPPDFRARLIDAGGRRDAVGLWATAAAALFLMTVLLRTATSMQVAGVRPQAADLTAVAVDRLAVALGGTAEARRVAEMITAQEQARATRAASAEAPR